MTVIIKFTPVFAKVCFAKYYTPVEGFAKEPFCSQIKFGKCHVLYFWEIHNAQLKALRKTFSFDGERMQPCGVEISDGSYKI